MAGGRTDPAVLFWLRVDKNGPVRPLLGTACWLWTGGKNKDGYGRFAITAPKGSPREKKQTHMPATRFAFWLEHGRWPTGLVLHSCDNPPCVNPSHLREGTQRENIQEAVAKGRIAYGERQGSHKLDAETVRRIRDALAAKSQRAVARDFGLNRETVNLVARGLRWAHVE